MANMVNLSHQVVFDTYTKFHAKNERVNQIQKNQCVSIHIQLNS